MAALYITHDAIRTDFGPKPTKDAIQSWMFGYLSAMNAMVAVARKYPMIDLSKDEADSLFLRPLQNRVAIPRELYDSVVHALWYQIATEQHLH